MPEAHYPGQRLSYGGQLCTVRYSGPVEGTEGNWLGVEWDDTGRGKHNGSRDGMRYFDCLSNDPTAGLFFRPSRPTDAPLGFFEALRKKYASNNESNNQAASDEEIRISGKTVEEVGFEKIRRQLANLQELQIVILDGLQIASREGTKPYHSTKDPDGVLSNSEAPWIHAHDLKIVELDLSRNLLETWADVAAICAPLRFLRFLKLNGNRFRAPDYPDSMEDTNPFQRIEDVALDNTLLTWTDIVSLTSSFPSLKSLSLSSNNFTTITSPLNLLLLTTLNLSSNTITSLDDIASLSILPNLSTLSLRGNPLRDLTSSSTHPPRFASLRSLDLTSTLLRHLQSLTPIPSSFPALTTLRTSKTTLSALPSSNLHSIARLATLKELNYQPITPPERVNAELYYLNSIAKELATTDVEGQDAILALHPRWEELCNIHGAPDLTLSKAEVTAPTLGARVTEFTFYVATSPSKNTQAGTQWVSNGEKDGEGTPSLAEKRKLIPLSVDTYRLKGIVTRMFKLPPLGCKLVWETGVMDPMPGREAEEGWSVSEDEDDGFGIGVGNEREHEQMMKEKGKWVEREVELVDGTREVGNFVEGKKARVRVEVRVAQT